jgi:hypothetical protein
MNMLWRKYGPKNVGHAAGVIAKKKRSPANPTETLYASMCRKIHEHMIIRCPECGTLLTPSLAVTVFYLPEVKVLLQQRYGECP